MAVNKVVFGDQTIMDISDSTVNANNLLSGVKAYGANGEAVTGAVAVNDGTLTIQQNGTTKGTFTANQSGNTTVNIETEKQTFKISTDWVPAKSTLQGVAIIASNKLDNKPFSLWINQPDIIVQDFTFNYKSQYDNYNVNYKVFNKSDTSMRCSIYIITKPEVT